MKSKGQTPVRRTVEAVTILLLAVRMAPCAAAEAGRDQASGARVIRPVAAVASSEYERGVGAHHLIDPSRLNQTNEHIGRIWGGNWLSGDGWNTGDNWVYIDLGAAYDLAEVRIWNYHENERPAVPELRGRGVKACSLWVASANAAVPVAGAPGGKSGAFSGKDGWVKLWVGELAEPPSTVNAVPSVGPTRKFDALGQKAIRYIGVDIDSRWGPDAYTKKAVGLSHIQVTGWGLTVCDPVPAASARGAELDSSLAWHGPDRHRPSAYEVYMGTERESVERGHETVRVTDSDRDGDPANTQFVPAQALAAASEYFWRVDAIVDGKPIRGATWSFKTGLCLDDLGFDEIVFVKRKPYSSDHNYSVVNNGTSPDRFLAENGIYVYNLRARQVRSVITAAGLPGGSGVIGKLSLSFDAKKVIFDYRKDTASGFRVWEVNLDGSGLRQLTFPPPDEAEKVARYGVAGFHTDDMHPCYLPDGGIVFTSSRCEHGILCFGQPNVVTVVLHRMDGDGGNIEQLTQSPVSEFSPAVLGDGRILYHRWEYLDKGARVGKTFWAMEPDGSKSEELFGLSDSDIATGAFMYAHQVPGDLPLLVCAVGPHYPQGNSVGPIKLIDLSKDNRTSVPLTSITPCVEVDRSQGGWRFEESSFRKHSQDGIGGRLYTHPYPVDENLFLVSHKADPAAHYMSPGAYSLYVIDRNGIGTRVYGDEDGTVSCWHPTPVRVRETPSVIRAPRTEELRDKNEAVCVVRNVYEGMDGVEPGSIKYIRINEAVPQYWDTKRKWSPNYHSASWSAALWPRVQWGIVPVEADGSAHFVVPADRNIFFQALDENYMEVQRERTYVNYRPGEVRTCIGCHERSGQTPPSSANSEFAALTRPPSEPGPQPGETDPRQVIHYPSDIQPIFDAKCVSCHGNKKPDAGLNLSGTITPLHSVSFEQIRNKGLAGPILSEFVHYTGADHANINGGYLPPKSLGSYKSGLVSIIRTTDSKDPHYQLLSKAELLKIVRWVDSNYQFYGTYYGRHHAAHANVPDFRRAPTFQEAISPLAPEWHR